MKAANEVPTESTSLVGDGTDGEAKTAADAVEGSSGFCSKEVLWQRRRFFLYIIAPYFAGFLYGYSIGAISGSVDSLDAAVDGTLTMTQKSALTSASLIGATVASLLTFYVGETLGSRKELILGGCLYLLGTIFTECTGAHWSFGAMYGWIFFSRCTYGFGIGFAMHGAPLYLSETSPADIRGLTIAGKELFIIIGMVTGYGVIAICDGAVNEWITWRISWSVPGFFAIGVVWIMLYAPSSPRWLVLKGRLAESADALRQLWPEMSADEAAREADETLRSLDDVPKDDGPAVAAEEEASKKAFNPCSEEEKQKWAKLGTARGALVGGLGLVFFQQLTGQPTVLYYAQSIFIDAGFSEEDAKFSDLYVGLAKFLATLVSLPLVDRLGRKPLLLFGITVMMIALILLALSFSGAVDWIPQVEEEGEEDDGSHPQVLVALMLYVAGYQFGFGPITWVMISELFPLHSRARALGMAVFMNFALNLITTFTNGPLVEALGQCALFSFFCVMCALSLVFVHFLLPETKGKTLEEIDHMMSSGDLPALKWILGLFGSGETGERDFTL